MGNSVLVRFRGGRELAEALRDIPRAAGRRAALATLKEAAAPLADAMRAGAPKASGEGAGSITVQAVRSAGNDVTVAVGPTRDYFYLAFSEWGSRRQPARPWARPAWDAHKGGFLDAIGAGLWKRIRAAAKRHAAKAPRA